MDYNDLYSISTEIRKNIVSMITNSRGGHLGSSLSETDILTVLFFHILNLSPENRESPDRDRFVLSKGHASEGLYCTLAAAGFIDQALLDRYLTGECPLTIHPTNHVPGIEVNTGALGHGFSVAVGMALAAKKSGSPYRVFVLTGDGELQEGSNWEAAMAAAHFELGNLTILVDNNGLQLTDSIQNTMQIEPLAEKFGAFGFDVHGVDGHSVDELAALLEALDYTGRRPHAVIAKTVKGKGISFMENIPEWHHRIPTEEECRAALKELGE
ncbi:MAG: transketolase [Spirochaetaceae bacterium]|jgi:transketolase|nr:transketolase [Spirochaetaceae bacterium]